MEIKEKMSAIVGANSQIFTVSENVSVPSTSGSASVAENAARRRVKVRISLNNYLLHSSKYKNVRTCGSRMWRVNFNNYEIFR